MKIDYDIKLDFDDVLLVPKRSIVKSRKDVDLIKTYKFYHSYKCWKGLPIISANMDTTGTFNMAKSLLKHNALTCLHKYYTVEDLIKFYTEDSEDRSSRLAKAWVSIGMSEEDLEKLILISGDTGIEPNICIDIANGYTEKFVEFCSRVRDNFESSIIMAGNVVTPEMVQELIIHGGVDIVKVGIGPGSACTTRLKTGVGYPQLSAIMECASAAHGLKSGDKRHGLICADGGCREPGDIVKAFAAGADFVMLGGMFAGADECEGNWEYYDNGFSNPWCQIRKKNLLFYGMSSKEAQEKHGEGLKDYRSSEGRVKKVPYKGPVSDILNDICGGLRSACTYCGATNLKDLPKTAQFIRVNRVHYDRSL